MKKKPILVLASSLLTGLLAGCGTTDPAGSSSPDVPSSEVPSSEEPSSSDEADLIDVASSLVETAVTKAELVANGTITYGYSSPKYGSSNDPEEIPFEWGEDENGDVLHYARTQWGSTSDYYVMKDADGSVVAAEKDADGKLSKVTYPEYKAVAFPFNELVGYSNYYWGTEELASKIFALAKADANKDLVISQIDGEWLLDFGYLHTDEYGDSSYYDLSLGFIIGSQGEFASVSVSSASYSSSDYDIDPELNTVTLHSGALASSVHSYGIAQKTGDRAFNNPYDIDGFYATSFDFAYEGSSIGADGIVIQNGDSAVVNFSNVLPATANFSFDEIETSLLSGGEDGLTAAFSAYNGFISLYASEVGSYEVQARSKNVTKSFKVTVEAAKPSSISVSYATKGIDEYNANTLDSEVTAYKDQEIVFQTNILPYTASQEVGATVSSAASDDYSLEKKTVQLSEWYSAEGWVFKAPTIGDYVLKFASADATEVAKEVTVHVAEAPTFAEILSSDYASKEVNRATYEREIRYYFSFTPDGTGETGKVEIEDRFNSKTETAAYKIAANEDGYYDVTLTHESGDELGLTLKIGADYSLKIYSPDDESGSGSLLSKVDFYFLAEGTYGGKDNSMTLDLSLSSDGNASVSFHDSNYDNYLYFEAKCEIVSGDAETGYSLRIVESDSNTEDTKGFPLPLECSIDASLTTITTSFTYSGTAYSYSLTRGA